MNRFINNGTRTLIRFSHPNMKVTYIFSENLNQRIRDNKNQRKYYLLVLIFKNFHRPIITDTARQNTANQKEKKTQLLHWNPKTAKKIIITQNHHTTHCVAFGTLERIPPQKVAALTWRSSWRASRCPARSDSAGSSRRDRQRPAERAPGGSGQPGPAARARARFRAFSAARRGPGWQWMQTVVEIMNCGKVASIFRIWSKANEVIKWKCFELAGGVPVKIIKWSSSSSKKAQTELVLEFWQHVSPAGFLS